MNGIISQYSKSNLWILNSILFSYARSVVIGMSTLVRFVTGLGISAAIGWIVIKFDADIHGPQAICPNDFGDHLTFLKRHQQVKVCSYPE